MIASHVNKIFLTMTTTSVHNSNSDDSDINKSNFDTNKSDFDVYFKSDNSDFNDEYDYELHERLTREEMARIIKLKNKSPTRPKERSQSDPQVNNDDFDKILIEIHKNLDIYFDDPTFQ